MLYTKPLTDPTTGKTLTNFEMGISSYNCEDTDEQQYFFNTDDIQTILKYNGLTMNEVFPDYSDLIYEYKHSGYKDLAKFMQENHPGIELNYFEIQDMTE